MRGKRVQVSESDSWIGTLSNPVKLYLFSSTKMREEMCIFNIHISIELPYVVCSLVAVKSQYNCTKMMEHRVFPAQQDAMNYP